MQQLPVFNQMAFALSQISHSCAAIPTASSITFSIDQITRVTSILFAITTDATVADRWIRVIYTINKRTSHILPITSAIPASTTALISLAVGVLATVTTVPFLQISAALPEDIFLSDTDAITISVQNGVAGDVLHYLYSTQLVWRLAR